MDRDPLVVSLRGASHKGQASRSEMRERMPWKLMLLALVLFAAVALLTYFRAPLLSVVGIGQSAAVANANATAQEEVAEVIAAVSKLIVLPEGEEPTVASVSDPEKLKDQPFFAQAKVGDKVLIYTKARKAYLYDPAQDKLLEVAPLTVDAAQ